MSMTNANLHAFASFVKSDILTPLNISQVIKHRGHKYFFIKVLCY